MKKEKNSDGRRRMKEFGCVKTQLIRPKTIDRNPYAPAIEFPFDPGQRNASFTRCKLLFPADGSRRLTSLKHNCREKVEICRHGCLDHCQLSGSAAHYIQERKDQVPPQYIQQSTTASIAPHDDNSSADRDHIEEASNNADKADGSLYDDVIQNGDEMTSIGGHFLDVEKSIPKAQAQTSDRLPPVESYQHESGEQLHLDNVDISKPFMVNVKTSRILQSPLPRWESGVHGRFSSRNHRGSPDTKAIRTNSRTGRVTWRRTTARCRRCRCRRPPGENAPW